jgi:VanZ family protein
MFKFHDWCYRRLPSRPLFWLISWCMWFSVLWLLSSSDPKLNNGLTIPNIDKLYHFGYFMIGGFFAANLLHLKPQFQWEKIVLIVTLVGAIVGAIDEYHQSFNPERSGNDLGDWLADTLGAYAGCLYCYLMWKRVATT